MKKNKKFLIIMYIFFIFMFGIFTSTNLLAQDSENTSWDRENPFVELLDKLDLNSNFIRLQQVSPTDIGRETHPLKKIFQKLLTESEPSITLTYLAEAIEFWDAKIIELTEGKTVDAEKIIHIAYLMSIKKNLKKINNIFLEILIKQGYKIVSFVGFPKNFLNLQTNDSFRDEFLVPLTLLFEQTSSKNIIFVTQYGNPTMLRLLEQTAAAMVAYSSRKIIVNEGSYTIIFDEKGKGYIGESPEAKILKGIINQIREKKFDNRLAVFNSAMRKDVLYDHEKTFYLHTLSREPQTVAEIWSFYDKAYLEDGLRVEGSIKNGNFLVLNLLGIGIDLFNSLLEENNPEVLTNLLKDVQRIRTAVEGAYDSSVGSSLTITLQEIEGNIFGLKENVINLKDVDVSPRATAKANGKSFDLTGRNENNVIYFKNYLNRSRCK